MERQAWQCELEVWIAWTSEGLEAIKLRVAVMLCPHDSLNMMLNSCSQSMIVMILHPIVPCKLPQFIPAAAVGALWRAHA